jgi:hypothetical protein
MAVAEVVQAHIVKARWAYSELASPRFGPGYAGSGPQHLFDAANAGKPFSILTAADHSELVRMLNIRRPQFAANVDASPLYFCVELTRGQVAQLWALPTFGPPNCPAIPFMDFFLNTYGVGNVSSAADPRFATPTGKSLPTDHEPVIVIRATMRHFLLDGYGRAVAFMRATNTADRLLAWCPLAATITE